MRSPYLVTMKSKAEGTVTVDTTVTRGSLHLQLPES